MKIAYVARQDGTDMRISKECNSLVAAGHEVTLVGWDRTPGRERPDPMPGVPRRLLRRAASYGPRGMAAAYPLFLRHVSRELHQLRPDVVHCVNEDLAGVVLGLRPRLHSRVLCDLFDSISLRWSGRSRPARAAVAMAARLVHARSDALIVTDSTRGALLSRHAFVVPNYPVDPGPELAFAPPGRTQRLRIYVGGSLTHGRGLATMAALLDRGEEIEVVTAGWVYDRFAAEFVRRRDVDHRGLLTPDESLRVAASCHAVLCFYDPVNRNNVLASPNKIYDAMCVGRPVIISEETAIADWVVAAQVGCAAPYHDTDAVAATLRGIPRDPDAVAASAARLRALFETGYSWSVAERGLFAAYETLAS